MGLKNWLATIVSTTGVNWCWTRLTSRNCCRKSARPAARLRVDAWNERCRKAGPCSRRLSPAGNRPAAKPHNSVAKNRESLFCGRRIPGSFGQMGELLHSLTQEELDPSPALYSLYLRTSFTGSEMKR